jgi:hypothetical protein
MDGNPQLPPITGVQGFKFTIGSDITKLDKLIRVPDADEVAELMGVILKKGVPCDTSSLRCDVQGGTKKSTFTNTQCQLGGSEEYVKRTDASKQSTSFTQVNITPAALNNPTSSQALRNGHDYSYRTGKVVIIELAQGAATLGTTASTVYTIACSNCNYKLTTPKQPTAQDLAKCKQCKKQGTLTAT